MLTVSPDSVYEYVSTRGMITAVHNSERGNACVSESCSQSVLTALLACVGHVVVADAQAPTSGVNKESRNARNVKRLADESLAYRGVGPP